MKKLLLIATVGVGLMGFTVYFVACFELLPVERRVIATAEIAQKPYRLEAIYVGAGATSLDGLEVQRVWDDGQAQLVGRGEMRGNPDSIKMVEIDSVVQVTLHYGDRMDTLWVRGNNANDSSRHD